MILSVDTIIQLIKRKRYKASLIPRGVIARYQQLARENLCDELLDEIEGDNERS